MQVTGILNFYLLGELAVKLGLVTLEQVEKSLAISADTGLPLGRVLVLSGLILETDLNNLIRCQTLLRESQVDFDHCRQVFQLIRGTDRTFDDGLAQSGWRNDPHKKQALLGELLIECGVLTEIQLESYLRQQSKVNMPLGRMLVSAGLITEAFLDTTLSVQTMIRQGKFERSEAKAVLREARNRQMQSSILPKSKSFYVQPAKNVPKVGELLVLTGQITEGRLMEVLEMSINERKSIGELLVEKRYLTKAQLENILLIQANLADGTIKLGQLKTVLARLDEGFSLGEAIGYANSVQAGSEAVDKKLLSFFEFIKCLDLAASNNIEQAFEIARRNQRIVRQALLISGTLDEPTVELMEQCFSMYEDSRFTFDELTTLYEYARRRNILIKDAIVELRFHRRSSQPKHTTDVTKASGSNSSLLDLKEVAEQMILVRDFANAREMYKQLLSSLKKHRDNRYLYCLERSSFVCCEMQDFKQSEAYQREAVDLTKELHGEMSLAHAQALSNLAKIHYFMGLSEDAINEVKTNIEISAQVLGRLHPDVACSWQNLGMLQYQYGKLKDATRSYYEAHKICLESLGLNHPTTEALLAKLSEVQGRLGSEAMPKETAESAGEEEAGIMTGNWRTIALDISLNPLEESF